MKTKNKAKTHRQNAEKSGWKTPYVRMSAARTRLEGIVFSALSAFSAVNS
jgi:hypothetical protein